MEAAEIKQTITEAQRLGKLVELYVKGNEEAIWDIVAGERIQFHNHTLEIHDVTQADRLLVVYEKVEKLVVIAPKWAGFDSVG